MNANQNSTLIFLVGFMGAGKTTVGRALATHLGYQFFDLDELITERTGKSVQQIFSELGETEFRRLEREAIQSCTKLVRSVVALGGGAYVHEDNRSLLRAIGKTIWLDSPLEVCLARIRGDKSRPLLGSEDEMRALLTQRRKSYADADHIVTADELNPEELSLKIAELLRQ